MSLALLLDELTQHRIELHLDGDKLRFRAPEGALTSELRARLTAHKEALIAHLHGQPLPEPEVLRTAAAPAQQRLWFINQLQGPSTTYNIVLRLYLHGELNPTALHAALDDMVRRHQSLRSAFQFEDNVLHFEIMRGLPSPWDEHDLSDLDETERTTRLNAVTSEVVLHCFDLSKPPLMRAAFVRLEAQEHVLLLNFHHCISDGWSFGIILQEIAANYEARSAGREPDLPPLKWQYTDFIAWQEQLSQRGVMDADLAFWRKCLADAPACSTLPSDYRRPPVQTFAGSNVPIVPDADIVARLRARAREWGASLNHLTLAASAIVLADFSGQHDLVLGLPMANRMRRELEPIVGMFVNVAPVRLIVDPTQSLSTFVAQVKQANTEAMQHCQLPFERLVEELVGERDLSMPPVFQVIHNFLPPLEHELSFGGLRVDQTEIGDGAQIAKDDCTFYFDDTDGRLTGSIVYATSLYRKESVERWSHALKHILRAMATGPDVPLGEVSRLSQGDQPQLATSCHGPVRSLPEDSLWSQFATTARDHAEVVAVEDGSNSITYAELARRAELVSAQLAARDIGPDMRVGLLLPRHADLFAAMLGIVHRGAVFVPLDRNQPPERLARMAATARLAAALCRPDEPAAAGLQCATIGIDAASWQAESTGPAPETIGPDDPLYLIFTSGSTGMPKAVNVPWRGLNNIISSHHRSCRLTQGERISQFASPSFDASLLEIWPTLLAGATLVVIPDELRLDPTALHDWLLRERITVHFSPTPLAEALLDLEWPAQAPLRLVTTGGQALRKRPRPGLPFQLMNIYGPTETSIAATSGLVAPADENAPLPSIGRPIDNMRLAILNDARRPVPPGAVGELYVGGPGVALGYFEDPEATARGFVTLPDEPETGWYRTGDLVRLLVDGELEFLGRADRQIKLRGHRIEPGEIENTLLTIDGVQQAAVRLEGDRLVAYLEAEGNSLTPEQVRQQLATVLPAAMVPAYCVILPELPRQNSGKIDLKSLPPYQPSASPTPSAPTTSSSGSNLETAIARAWASVLGQTSPNRDDNFFDLGGHSLLLVQLKERIAAETGREVSVLDLFRHPTIGRQTEFLTGDTPQPVVPTTSPRRLPADESIAIIGMAGRFPEADNIEEFWANLLAGRDCISRFSREEMLAAGLPSSLIDRPDYVPANGVLRDIDLFDAGFFGVSTREAEVMDPQQRLLLEESWHTFEDAGYDPANISDRVGVFVGSSLNGYLIEHVLPRRDIMESLGGFAVLINNDKDFAATRISYKLGLRGPSLSINTACSTSLVAVHQAVTALRDGQCEMALAGGACARNRQVDGYLYEEGGILSHNGCCRTFDADATGMVGGNGVALVLLKPLAAALADGDHIYATIKGIAANNDGADKVGFTAPGVHGQSLVIRDALDRAGVDPQTVHYVEAHGTATQLGDTIEVAALAENYTTGTPRAAPLRLGSIKSNIGHLDAAAGAAGLIKTALCLHARTFVPSLYFQSPNSQIPWPGNQFEVGTRTEPWADQSGPRRAAVSSLGIGGTNAHAILEEAPPRARRTEPEGASPALLLISGRENLIMQANAQKLAAWLRHHPHTSLADIAHTLAFGRRHWDQRAAICAASHEEAAELLAETLPPVTRASGMAFLFTGMGTHQPGMAAALYAHAPVFREQIDRCAEVLQPVVDLDIRHLLLASPDDADALQLLHQHRIGQPAVFALEYALAKLWMDLGLKPSMLIGHSLGEWVAACLAGVFSLADALRLVSLRGGLMDAQPTGAMLAINLTESEVTARLPDALDIAVINAPDQIVVSGPSAAVEALAGQLESEEIRCKRLPVTLAAHSALMEPVMTPLREAIAGVTRQPPNPVMAVVSNVTGQVLDAAQLQSPDYWAEHVRRSVRFADGLATLWQHPGLALLECGPSHTLCNLAMRDPQRPDERTIVASLDGGDATPEAEWQRFLASAGTLWAAGLPIDREKLFAMQPAGRRIPLPGYAFQREQYWLEAVGLPDTPGAHRSSPPHSTGKRSVADTTTTSDPNLVEQRVIDIMHELLGAVRIGRNSDFFLCGGDSLLAVRLATRINDHLGKTLARAQVIKARTPARIAALIAPDDTSDHDREENEHESDNCLVRLWAGDEQLPPIVLIHAVGGGIFIYRELLQALDTPHPVYGLQAPGLWDDDSPIDDLCRQAAHYHACLLRAGIEDPVCLGGSSYGGIVAYELDRLYRQSGHRPSLVTLFDSPGPGHMPARLESDAEIYAYLLSRDTMYRNFAADLATLKAMPPAERDAMLLDVMRANGQKHITPDDVVRQVRVFRQNLINMWDWQPQPPHASRLLFFKASEHAHLLDASPEMAWVPLAGDGIEILPVPGDHSSMLSFPHVSFLAKELNLRLSLSPNGSTGSSRRQPA